MPTQLKIAVVQTEPKLAQCQENLENIASAIKEAAKKSFRCISNWIRKKVTEDL